MTIQVSRELASYLRAKAAMLDADDDRETAAEYRSAALEVLSR